LIHDPHPRAHGKAAIPFKGRKFKLGGSKT